MSGESGMAIHSWSSSWRLRDVSDHVQQLPLFWSLGDSIAMYRAWKEFWFQYPDPCDVSSSIFPAHSGEKPVLYKPLHLSPSPKHFLTFEAESWQSPSTGQRLPLRGGYDGYHVCTVLLCIGDHGFFLLLPHSCFIFINQLAVLLPTEEFNCPSMPYILMPPYTSLNSVLVFIFLNSPVSMQLWSFGDSIHSSPLAF